MESDISANEIHTESAKLSEFRRYLRKLTSDGGPQSEDYTRLTEGFSHLVAAKAQGAISVEAVCDLLGELGEAMSPLTMQGFARAKPHGYSGDFEMIERIYSQWTSPRSDLAKWDHYFHAQAAPKAVRNRKEYFRGWLKTVEARFGGTEVRVLNVGSGPARDVLEVFTANPNSKAVIECLDHDEKANAFASALCNGFADRIVFHHSNALRFHPARKYRAIWSGGLFDYLNDRLFVLLLRRLIRALDTDGELVIGNFSTTNPTRPYMEIVGEWFLNHRTTAELLALAAEAGVNSAAMSIRKESEGVNLFLHITNVPQNENQC